jgi:type I restriction-modification system DNA methylase subunit
MNHSEIVSFIWGVADLIRDTFKRGKYQDVILPITEESEGSNNGEKELCSKRIRC